jgi:hypothetical protein
MRRITVSVLLVGLLLSSSTAGLIGCGGSEAGTQQISEKAAPDPELAAEKVPVKGQIKGRTGLRR